MEANTQNQISAWLGPENSKNNITAVHVYMYPELGAAAKVQSSSEALGILCTTAEGNVASLSGANINKLNKHTALLLAHS